MRRFLAFFGVLLCLTGCGKSFPEMDAALALRQRLLNCSGYTFDAVITADYGDCVYTFGMQCRGEPNGSLSFTVVQPETIAGITGTISAEGGKLTYDGLLLAFEPLADGQISPVYAPWLMLHTLRSGYVRSSGKDDAYIRISMDDSFAEEALQTEIWTDSENGLIRSELVWNGRRILSVDVKNFLYL